ncbi:hypothetical protein [Dongia rigui]|uniref:Uncharacterized protein n=1 Tax=Dongia rigui TaxID=940149 RepID=A0ABU5E3B6_9PROT|nr:hypothetical protein [Dongia rigui]MDY0873867.1 hypothetical protein [Dongia rigui]
MTQVTNANPTIVSIMAFSSKHSGRANPADPNGSDIFGNLVRPSYETEGGLAADKPVTDVTRL